MCGRRTGVGRRWTGVGTVVVPGGVGLSCNRQWIISCSTVKNEVFEENIN